MVENGTTETRVGGALEIHDKILAIEFVSVLSNMTGWPSQLAITTSGHISNETPSRGTTGTQSFSQSSLSRCTQHTADDLYSLFTRLIVLILLIWDCNHITLHGRKWVVQKKITQGFAVQMVSASRNPHWRKHSR